MNQVVFATPARNIPMNTRLRFQRCLFKHNTAFDAFMKEWGNAFRNDGFYLVNIDTKANE
jgi:hypothetical protein